MSKSNKKLVDLSHDVLEMIGGVDNVSIFSHCTTRLRFEIKDQSLIDDEKIKKIPGVYGTQWLGNQYQVVVGAGCDEWYQAICREGGFKETTRIDENLDEHLTTNKFSLKKVGQAIMGYASPVMTSVIPVLMGAGIFSAIKIILGPTVLGLISDTSDLYMTFDLIYNAFFYFTPIYLGYTAAKTLNIDPIYGIFAGCIILVPNFIALIGLRETVSIFGIPTTPANYSATFLPVMLGTWIISLLIKWLQKVLPEIAKATLLPIVVMGITTPLMLCFCAPLGAAAGNAVGNLFITLSETNTVLSVLCAVALAVLMPYLVLFGMHGALVSFAMASFMANGFDSFLLPIMMAYNFSVYGIAFGVFLKLRNKEEKSQTFSCFLTGILGSVSEPSLYGVIMKYKGMLKILALSGVAYGLYSGIFHPAKYAMTSANIFTFWASFVTDTGSINFINGMILSAIAFFVPVILVFVLNKKIEPEVDA